MTTSLYAFCKENNLPKTSVRAWLIDNGYSTADGLDSAALEAATAQFCKPQPQADELPPTPEAEAAIRPEVLPEGFWQSSELAPIQSKELALPEGFDAAAMIRHFDGVMGQATDTQSLVAIAKLAITAADAAMDQKVAAQRQALTQAEQDSAQLAAMVTEAQTSLKIKALESKMLAERQTASTAQVEATFANLMALGKPATPPTGEPS